MFAIRAPTAAGTFYNLEKNLLTKEIEASFKHKLGPKQIKSEKLTAAIVPHDKIHLSGHVSAWVFSKIEKANYVMIGPNHNQVGSRFALMREGMWKTPFGEIIIDPKISQRIIDKTKIIEYDVLAHKDEHALEVQLPFLQYKFGNDFKIVPISITNSFADLDFVNACIFVGKNIARTIQAYKEKWILLGTTDLSNGTIERVKKIDKILLKAILSLKPEKIFDAMFSTNSHICGYGATIVTIAAAKELGAKKSKLLQYASSFDVIQDPASASGYASLIIY